MKETKHQFWDVRLCCLLSCVYLSSTENVKHFNNNLRNSINYKATHNFDGDQRGTKHYLQYTYYFRINSTQYWKITTENGRGMTYKNKHLLAMFLSKFSKFELIKTDQLKWILLTDPKLSNNDVFPWKWALNFAEQTSFNINQINLRRLQSVCYLHQHLCHLIWLRGCLFLSSGVNFPVLREKVKIMATFVPCPREMMTVKSSWGFFIRL